MAINTITLSGRMVADPELRYTQSGTAVANGSIAVTDGYGDNEKTYFFNWEAWKHNAEYLANYAKKGMQVTLAGKLTQQTWQANDGSNRSKVVINISDVVLPPKGGKNDRNNSSTSGNAGGGGYGSQNQLGLGEEISFDTDDLPF